ncbi:type II secretion system F family protein [Rhabdochlamydiaceae symbiont of Dictyostelium giganteum]|uniref:type II secretion system F family protein n=1 Tax=Rhabdochlamydiaceae symbiont of Dictyostelium giganteum TaxID=3342349 RepID=UPI00384DABAF
MPLFQFKGFHTGGKSFKGVIEADSLQQALDKLHTQQIVITHLKEYAQLEKKLYLSQDDLLHIMKMLGQLYAAGLSLYESIMVIEERYQAVQFHPLLLMLKEAIKQGEPLSSAFMHFQENINPTLLAILKSGEESGNLNSSFQQITHLLEEKKRIKKQMIKALSYPLFLLSFCTLLFISLLQWMIPSMRPLMEGKTLHPLTAFMFSLSDFFIHYSLVMLLALFLLSALVLFALKQKSIRIKLDEKILKVPFIGQLFLLSITVRFSQTVHFLLEGSVPIVQALNLTQSLLSNHFLEHKLAQTTEHIIQGKLLSSHVEWLPPLVSKMVLVGERTGRVSSMLVHVAKICEEEFQEKMHQLTALIQPLLLLFLGVMIGITVLMILIPLTDIGAVLQS